MGEGGGAVVGVCCRGGCDGSRDRSWETVVVAVGRKSREEMVLSIPVTVSTTCLGAVLRKSSENNPTHTKDTVDNTC